ncbi:hypothetical protein LPJ79_000088 [Coemansia sp. RSA 1821]|nr:hypothetical protein LPJ79_000088 [Coemansia sp. RSA 1821]KAJ2676926.1 hypothetical protein IWW42_000264 [Coemansia sp. RSA 1085]
MNPTLNEWTAPAPPPTPGIPVERHPYNDDWGTTFVAILVMSLIVFVALGVLVRNSFRLVPTGVMALHTLVGRGDEASYHQLQNEEDEEDEEDEEALQLRRSSSHSSLTHSEVNGGAEDARVIHIDSSAQR